MKIFSPTVNPIFLTGLTVGAQVKFFDPFYILKTPAGFQILSDSDKKAVIVGFTTTFPNQGTNVVGFHALFEEAPAPISPGIGEAQIESFDVFYELNPPVAFEVITEPEENIVVIGFSTTFPNQGSNVVGFHAIFEE